MADKSDGSGDVAGDHIEELNGIDSDVAKLLEAAGLAIQALSGTDKADGDTQNDEPRSIEQQRVSFSDATHQYFGLLSSIDVRLRKQIEALEDAEIIPAEAVARSTVMTQSASPGLNALRGGASLAKTAERPKNVGATLGNLDVGWLNSRNDSMKQKMEVDLWKSAQELLVRYEDVTAKAPVDGSIDTNST